MTDPVKFFKEAVEVIRLLKSRKDVLDYVLVGSALYLDDARDLDVLVLFNGTSFASEARFAFGGDWSLCAGEYSDTDDSWGAIRKGNINLIITVNAPWFDGMHRASEVCRALKLADKGDRIMVHRIVRDRYDAEDAHARRDGTR